MKSWCPSSGKSIASVPALAVYRSTTDVVTVSGDGAVRPFEVAAGVTVELARIACSSDRRTAVRHGSSAVF